MPRIWITRSQPLAEQSAARLLDMGYDAIAASLIQVKFTPIRLALPENAHLIFTSRNALRAFALHITERNFPCLCVGDATAKAARGFGFAQAVSANGNADDVVAWAQDNISRDTPIYHIAGNHPRGDIIERLEAFGFSNAQREIFYNTDIVSHDPRPFKCGDDIILLYSPLAAKSLISLGLDMEEMGIISISAAVDAALGDISCKSRLIAARPREDSLLTHLPPL